VAVVTAFSVFAQEHTPLLSYADRDCWTFRVVSKNYLGYTSNAVVDGDYEVCVFEGKFYLISGSAKSEILKDSPENDGIWCCLLYMEDNRHLKFPLFVGQKWTETFQTRTRGTNRTVTRTSETQVLGVKPVTTSAGTYDAFKIERGSWSGGRLASKWIYFYSPQTKSVVKYNYGALMGSSATREIELVKFRSDR
jgi:hypothetical protein